MLKPNFPVPKCPIHGRAIKRDSCAACNVAHMHKYTDLYASELRWLEDHRQVSTDKQFGATIGSAIAYPPSRWMTGCWQRRRVA